MHDQHQASTLLPADRPASLIKCFPYLLLTGILLNVIGLFSGITEPDSALYASIAKHIAVTNDWINLIGNGHDWLDKPHLPFWLCAASFKCFGITAFAYRLPALICWLGGVIYIYKLANAIFDDNVARISVIVYITAMHVVFSNSDLRAEAFLTAFVIASIYHIYMAMNHKWSGHIIIAAIYCALAVMTKGIFILITIASGFIIYWVFTKQLKQFFQIKWVLIVLLTFIFIIPELYCLYLQFDLHPEKIIFGHTNVSGIRFFFWDSQFGRFFNNGPIKGSGDIFFFIHTFLWAFIPWSLITVIALMSFVKKGRKLINKESLIITGGLLITFIMFSVSKFQLPHYLVIVFPQFAIITGRYLSTLRSALTFRNLNMLQLIMFILSIGLIGYITKISGLFNWFIPLTLIAIITSILLVLFIGNDLSSLMGKSICWAALLYLFYFLSFNPSVLKYNAGMEAGKWLNEHSKVKNVFMYKCDSEAFEFYTKTSVGRISNLDSMINSGTKDSVLVYAPLKEIENLPLQGRNFKIIQQFNYFHITKLSLNFLQNNTRQNVTEKYVLASFP